MAVMYKEQEFTIHTTHCDFLDFLRPYSVLDFFQDLASTNADEIGVGFDYIKSLGYIWIVLYEQFEVVKGIPKFGDTIIVKTWPKPKGRLEFEREYEIWDRHNNLLIKGISNWALMDIEKRCIVRGERVDFLGEYYLKTNYPEKQKRKLNLSVEPTANDYAYKVLLSDLDHNLHVNNAKYLDILYNMQTVEHYKKWKKVEVSFLHEAQLNDEIVIRQTTIENKDCYKGYLGDTPCFEAVIIWEE